MEKSEMKELLVQAWKEVFEVEEVPEDADFFEEGGDSIKAVQLSSWLMQKGVKLDLGKIFYTPSLSQMAETLEETDPVYVPDQLLTKDIIKEKMASVMQNAGQAGPGGAPFAGNAGNADEQICDPKQMQGDPNQQICDPKQMQGDPNQQICDPRQMQGDSNQQICDPKQMQGGPNQQICDPKQMQGDPNQQICDPNPMANGANGQICDPNPMSSGRNAEFNMMMSMFQTILAQQQVMLQMMQLTISRLAAPPMIPPIAPPSMPPMGQFPSPGNTPGNLPPEAMAQFQKMMGQYASRKVDKPIDKPNVIGINPAKVTKPTHSAEEVLAHVLSGLFPKGYSKTEDLFAQGLTSLDTVKMVTRCGEHGYALGMQDIYMNSTFGELVKCMKPGA